MTRNTQRSAAGFASLLVALAFLCNGAIAAVGDASLAPAKAATILAFNPQPDPPGRPIDEDGFDHG